MSRLRARDFRFEVSAAQEREKKRQFLNPQVSPKNRRIRFKSPQPTERTQERMDTEQKSVDRGCRDDAGGRRERAKEGTGRRKESEGKVK